MKFRSPAWPAAAAARKSACASTSSVRSGGSTWATLQAGFGAALGADHPHAEAVAMRRPPVRSRQDRECPESGPSSGWHPAGPFARFWSVDERGIRFGQEEHAPRMFSGHRLDGGCRGRRSGSTRGRSGSASHPSTPAVNACAQRSFGIRGSRPGGAPHANNASVSALRLFRVFLARQYLHFHTAAKISRGDCVQISGWCVGPEQNACAHQNSRPFLSRPWMPFSPLTVCVTWKSTASEQNCRPVRATGWCVSK